MRRYVFGRDVLLNAHFSLETKQLQGVQKE